MGIPPDIVLFVILLCFAKQGGCFPLTAAILGYSFVTVKQPVLKRCMMEKATDRLFLSDTVTSGRLHLSTIWL